MFRTTMDDFAAAVAEEESYRAAQRKAAEMEARAYVKKCEDACFEWWRCMRLEGLSPTDAMMEGKGRVVMPPPPCPDPGPMPSLVVADVALFFLQFPSALPAELEGIAVRAVDGKG